MAQLKKDSFERQFKKGDYSPLITLMLYEMSRKGKFSYEEIYHKLAEKFATLNKEMSIRAVNQLEECLDMFISDGYLDEGAGVYYPTGNKKCVKTKVVVE